jgi:predicted HicB family RNase H-like nuclease
MVPLKLAFRINHFEAIKEAATASGASINKYVHGRITKDLELSQ